MADKKIGYPTSVGEAIGATEIAIKHLKSMAAHGRKPDAAKYAHPVRDLEVVLQVLKGYQDDLESGRPVDNARTALREACRPASRGLKEINPGLSSAYETLPDRIEEGHSYRQKGESAFGAPEIAIWLISFAIIYGILRNANIF